MANKEVIISWQKSQILITTKINYFLAPGWSVHHSEIHTEVAEKKNCWQTKQKLFKKEKGQLKLIWTKISAIYLAYINSSGVQNPALVFCCIFICFLIHVFHCPAHCIKTYCIVEHVSVKEKQVLQMSVGWCMLELESLVPLKGCGGTAQALTPSLHKTLSVSNTLAERQQLQCFVCVNIEGIQAQSPAIWKHSESNTQSLGLRA